MINARARTLLKEYDVRGGEPRHARGSLSGGNQQKVCIAREIASNPKLLIAHQPTRGLDVGAIEFVHRRLLEPSATRAAGSCWCRSSPRRCARSPTASS